MNDNWLILETSGRVGRLGLAREGAVVREAALDERKRHARDLAFAVSSLLESESLTPAELAGIVAGRGPGSYTGLRVGLMSAKALAYALGCELRAVDTFAAIAEQSPTEAQDVWVIADALRGHVYVQHFFREEAGWRTASELSIESVDIWLAQVRAGQLVSGPGVAVYEERFSSKASIVPEAAREPRVASLFAVGMRAAPLSRAEFLALEPLYLRGSAAEEKRKPTGEPRR